MTNDFEGREPDELYAFLMPPTRFNISLSEATHRETHSSVS